jgi:hypothetical protein
MTASTNFHMIWSDEGVQVTSLSDQIFLLSFSASRAVGRAPVIVLGSALVSTNVPFLANHF